MLRIDPSSNSLMSIHDPLFSIFSTKIQILIVSALKVGLNFLISDSLTPHIHQYGYPLGT